jgi:chemotaxis protein CheX
MLLGTRDEKELARMSVSLRGSIARVADPENLDSTVQEVLAMMLGTEVKRRDEPIAVPASGSVTAVVGFGGLMSGACILRASDESARKLAGRMTGIDFPEVDEMVQDGIGELCNMLASSWKSKVPELAAHCGLSVPAVITGCNYNLHVQEPAFEVCRGYEFDDASFEVKIVSDGVN